MKQKYAVALQLALKKYQSGFGHFGLKFDQQQPHLHAKTLSQHDDVNRYVSLRLRMQNRRRKWNFPLNFRTMRKLSELYSGIFQTQSSGCVSGLDHFRNFTNLKILNI